MINPALRVTGTILKTTKILARAGVAGALYTVLTIVLAPISYGPIQFRLAEALTLLPLVFPETSVGLTIGCLIANIYGGNPLDMVLGTVATLISAALTAVIGKLIRKKIPKLIVGALPPIVINAFIVPLTFLTASDTAIVYFTNVATVFFGQAVVIGVLGPLVYLSTENLSKHL